MKEKENIAAKRSFGKSATRRCVSPEQGNRIGQYVAGTLSLADEDVYEDHLLTCEYCKETFLTVSGLILGARQDPNFFADLSDIELTTEGNIQVLPFINKRGGS
jgi:hypothetical protein